VLTGNARVGRAHRFAEIGSVARDTRSFGQQLRCLCGCLGCLRLQRDTSAGGFVIGGQIGNVLRRQARRQRAHAGVLALAGLVGIERRRHVSRPLPGQLGHPVGLRKRGVKTLDAVAAHTQGVLV